MNNALYWTSKRRRSQLNMNKICDFIYLVFFSLFYLFNFNVFLFLIYFEDCTICCTCKFCASFRIANKKKKWKINSHKQFSINLVNQWGPTFCSSEANLYIQMKTIGHKKNTVCIIITITYNYYYYLFYSIVYDVQVF